MGKISKAKILIRNPEGKRPLGKPGCSWEDDIKIDLVETARVWTSSGSNWEPVAGSCEHENTLP
jgi:hypothetical protein